MKNVGGRENKCGNKSSVFVSLKLDHLFVKHLEELVQLLSDCLNMLCNMTGDQS